MCGTSIKEEKHMGKIKCVTIGRLYCAGGSSIGQLVSKRLNIPCYDREIIEMASMKSGIPMTDIKKYEEALLSPMKTPIHIFGKEKELSLTEKIFAAETEVIYDLTSGGECIIVGRCADFILKNKVKTLNVFIYASKEKRMNTATNIHDIPFEEAEARLKRYDKKRADYYNANTNKKWGEKDSYDLCLDSGKLGYEMCADIIADTVKLFG
jgi:cytidylate kinase